MATTGGAPSPKDFACDRGAADEAPQHVAGRGPHDPKGHLKTTQGIRVSDSQNQRNPGQYGAVLLEDLSCARRSLTSITSASSTRVALRRTAISNSTNPRRRSPSFISFSALTSGRRHLSAFQRSPAAPVRSTRRAMCGFAVQFCTREGNWDLVGDNIPLLAIQRLSPPRRGRRRRWTRRVSKKTRRHRPWP